MTPHETIRDWTLELFVLGELPPRETAALSRRLSQERELAARVEELRASNRAILSQVPPKAVVAEVRRRLAARTLQRRPFFASAAFAIAAAAAIALLVVPLQVARKPEGTSGERLKGAVAPHLIAFRIRGRSAEPLADGARVRPGEVIQLAYAAAGLEYGVILSIDGRGATTLHWPEELSQPPRLKPNGQVALPHAFQLDDAPGFERFVLVAAREPIAVSRVLEAIRASRGTGERRLDLPPSWTQSALQLDKEHQ
ncbi:MAG TPA: ActD-like protein [Anaeromyxobacteraceae bacterium]|nr:ActD-like protein [Anaeromyxobacteraceae bacterium]